ncbi:MAG: hypothetical protein ACREDU_01080 [Methylocella sp.]
MPDLRDSASNLHAVLLRREFSARDLLGSTLAAIACRKTSPRKLRVALWLDEPFAPVDATVAAAVRKAALMLELRGPHGHHLRRDARSSRRKFQGPADGLALRAAARLTSKQFAIAANASCKSGGLA